MSIAFLVAIAVAPAALPQQQVSPLRQYLGKAIPDFSMKTSDGGQLTKKSLKGKVVILDFWASWCGPCKVASPSMQALHKKFSKKGLRVIGVNAGEKPGAGNVAAAYKKEHGYTYTFTRDNDKFALKIGIASFPTFVILDKQGRVHDFLEGWYPEAEQQLGKLISDLLARKG